MTDSLNSNRIKIDGDKGFTLVELMIVIAILGILAAITVPNVIQYLKRAEFAALKAEMYAFMNAEDAYYAMEGKYFPNNGVIDIPSGSARNIPELGFSLKNGHKHRFYLLSINMDFGSWKRNYCYLIVYADGDYNSNGPNDLLYLLTYAENGEFVNQREFYQLL